MEDSYSPDAPQQHSVTNMLVDSCSTGNEEWYAKHHVFLFFQIVHCLSRIPRAVAAGSNSGGFMLDLGRTRDILGVKLRNGRNAPTYRRQKENLIAKKNLIEIDKRKKCPFFP